MIGTVAELVATSMSTGAWSVLCTGFLAAAVLVGVPVGAQARLVAVRRSDPRIASNSGAVSGRGPWRDRWTAQRTARSGGTEVALEDVVALADQVAALARAGLPIPRIWSVLTERGSSATVRAWAGHLAAAHVRGENAAQALTRAGATSGIRWLAVALHVSQRTGAALAETLDGFAAALRSEHQADQERAGALAGPRATTWILTLLPLAGLVLGGLVGGRPWHVLLATRAGHVCLLVGGLLWLGGRLWAAALVRRAESVR
jgi:tight adherence protein B